MNDFRVLESERWPSSSYFAEFYPLAGPAAVADIGNGSQRERYGWNWLVLITRDRVAEAYQERPAASGEWHLVTNLMPPVFGTVLPEGSRRLTAVFDQSGRMIIAYEHAGLVRVTRWDVETQQYVQNVTFPGVNPALTIDLQAGINPSDSDVLLFYQPDGDLTQVHCRVQRELYLTPHVVHSGVEELILDRALVNSLQLELLVSDASGNPLRGLDDELLVLASDYYPRFVEDKVLLDAVPTTAIYENTTLVRGVEDAVLLDATPTIAQYVGNIAFYSPVDAVLLDATPTVAEYRDNTHLESVQDAVILDATPTTVEYVLFIVANPQPVDHVILDATPTVAIYREVPS